VIGWPMNMQFPLAPVTRRTARWRAQWERTFSVVSWRTPSVISYFNQGGQRQHYQF